MSKILAWQQWQRFRTAAERVRTIDYQKLKAEHEQKRSDQQAAIVLGLLSSGIVSTVAIMLTFQPGPFLYGMVLKAGIAIGAMVVNHRPWFVVGLGLGTLGSILMLQLGLVSTFIGGVFFGFRFGKQIRAVTALSVRLINFVYKEMRRDLGQAAAEVLILWHLGPPEEFYGRTKDLTDAARKAKNKFARRRLQRTKWLLWRMAQDPRYRECYARDLARTGVAYKSALGIAADIQTQQCEWRLAELRKK